MSRTKSLSVSVIIPCYNEEQAIRRCLEALEVQTVKPHQIILVDNNCSDKTVELAKSYKLIVVKEARQGLIFARNKGFSMASGQIIAKLDADSMPAPNWIETVQEIFKDKDTQAASGTGYFYDAPAKWFVRAQRNLFAVWLNRLVLGHHMLWGSNLAIRTSAWQVIEAHCCNRREIMEDLDIAAHLVEKFGKRSIVYKPEMHVDISGRRSMVSFKRNWGYLKMWPRTLSLHGYQRRIILWPAIAFLLFWMSLANKIGRFYNYEENRMIYSLYQWRNNPLYTRDNP